MNSGIIAERKLTSTEGEKVIHVVPLIQGRARLCIGPANSRAYDDVW